MIVSLFELVFTKLFRLLGRSFDPLPFAFPFPFARLAAAAPTAAAVGPVVVLAPGLREPRVAAFRLPVCLKLESIPFTCPSPSLNSTSSSSVFAPALVVRIEGDASV